MTANFHVCRYAQLMLPDGKGPVSATCPVHILQEVAHRQSRRKVMQLALAALALSSGYLLGSQVTVRLHNLSLRAARMSIPNVEMPGE